MKEKLNCEVVKDLLPNYIENLTSEQTTKMVDEHLADCQDCTAVYKQMQGEMTVEKAPEVKEMKKFLNKAKMMYLTMAVLILGALGILAPVIVDLAVNKGLTWSLISTGGVLFAYATGYFLIKGGKYRWEKAMACISILVLPFLALIQFVNNQYLFSEQSAWFGSVALPTTLLWLAIIWAALLIWRFTKLNWLISTGVLLLLSLPGNYYTNKFSGSVDSFQNYMTDFLLNGFLNLLGAIACIVIGIVLRNKLKKFK